MLVRDYAHKPNLSRDFGILIFDTFTNPERTEKDHP